MQIADSVRPLPRGIFSLQAGRAVAAILVVLFHDSVAIFALPKYWGTKPFGRLFDFGDSGVYFFFVLSGFIILHAHDEDLGRRRIAKYIYKRFVRIYPTYWIILLLVLPPYFIDRNFGLGLETRPDVIVSSFLLIHFNSLYSVVAVAWTLFHEILFYALFSIAIWSTRLGLVVFLLWFAASAVGLFTTGAGRDTDLFLPLKPASPFWLRYDSGLVFAPKVGAAAHDCRPYRRMRVSLRGCGSSPLAHLDWRLACVHLRSWLCHDDYRPRRTGTWRTAENPTGPRVARRCVLQHLSGAFFRSVNSGEADLAERVGPLLPPMFAYCLLAFLAITSGTLFHLWIERPMLTFLRGSQHAAPAKPVRMT